MSHALGDEEGTERERDLPTTLVGLRFSCWAGGERDLEGQLLRAPQGD